MVNPHERREFSLPLGFINLVARLWLTENKKQKKVCFLYYHSWRGITWLFTCSAVHLQSCVIGTLSFVMQTCSMSSAKTVFQLAKTCGISEGELLVAFALGFASGEKVRMIFLPKFSWLTGRVIKKKCGCLNRNERARRRWRNLHTENPWESKNWKICLLRCLCGQRHESSTERHFF